MEFRNPPFPLGARVRFKGADHIRIDHVNGQEVRREPGTICEVVEIMEAEPGLGWIDDPEDDEGGFEDAGKPARSIVQWPHGAKQLVWPDRASQWELVA